MIAWLPLNIGEEQSKVILASFVHVFPETVVFLPEMTQRSEAYLVGFRDQASVNWDNVVSRFNRYAREDLELFGWHDPIYFLGSMRAAPQEIPSLFPRGTLLNRDARPVLDFIDDETFGAFVHRLRTAEPDVTQVVRIAPNDQETGRQLAALRRADRLYRRGCDPLGDDLRRVDRVRESDEAVCRSTLREFPTHANASRAIAEVLTSRALQSHDPVARNALLTEAITLFPNSPRANLSITRTENASPTAIRDATRRLRVLLPYRH